MTFQQVISDLKSRGEKNISFNEETGIIVSKHGRYTTNYWIIDANDELKCIDCRTSYN